MNELRNISNQFLIEGEITKVSPFGSGHINDTFKLETERKNYILQRINGTIFLDIPGLMQNIVGLSEYFINQSPEESKQVLTPIKTKDGKHLHKDSSGEFWRVMNFIENSRSFDRVENPEIAYEGGKAYGWFVRSLTDFPLNKLKVTIPHFHDIQFRLDNFLKAMETDIRYRVELVPEDIDFVFNRAEEMKIIAELGNEDKIPLRVTHNDTKINNVLFNDNNKAICVIDLDTVMPGYSLFDFGDAIRTFANSSDEDEKELAKISLNLDFYKSFSQGFLSETKDILTREELNYLAFSAKYITFEQGVRFLTDYLEGDHYYKIKYPNHNLFRARAQFKLLERMENRFAEMENIISEIVNDPEFHKS